MEKIFKKSLALVLSAALCLTALVGCLTVSADETTTPIVAGNYEVKDAEGVVGKTAEIFADYTNISTICAHYVEVTFPAGITVNAVSKQKTQMSEGSDATETIWVPLTAYSGADDGWDYKPTENEDGTTVIESCEIINFLKADGSYDDGEKNAELHFKFDVTIDKDLTPGAYNVTVVVKQAATQDEKWVAPATDDGVITVKAETPACDHDYVGVVTTRPTIEETGIRTFTCSKCEDSYTEIIPVATVKDKTDGDIYKVGHTLDLQSNIQIAYLLRPQYINEAVSYYAVIKKDIYDVAGNVVSTESTTFEAEGSNFADIVIDKTDRKIIRYNGVKSTEMGTIPCAEFYRELSDGTFECIVDNYGIVSYAKNILPSSYYTTALKTLIVDLLNYGTAAQKYFKYNTANLVNTEFEKYLSLATSSVPSYTSSAARVDNTDKVIRLGRTLDMASSITVVADINDKTGNKAYAGDLTALKAFYKYIDATGKEVTGWLESTDFVFNKSTNRYSVYFDKFTAREMGSAVELSVYDGDKLVSDTITYSIESYMAYVANNYTYLTDGVMLKELMECMLKYGFSAGKAL